MFTANIKVPTAEQYIMSKPQMNVVKNTELTSPYIQLKLLISSLEILQYQALLIQEGIQAWQKYHIN